MTGHEHEAQDIVTNVIVDRGVQIGHGRLLLRFELVAQLPVLALEHRLSAELIDRAVLRGGHEPCPRIVRHAGLGPPLERSDERILSEILRETDVADDPRQSGNELRRLDPPDRVDRGMCIGSRHGYQSGHLSPSVQDHHSDPRCALRGRLFLPGDA